MELGGKPGLRMAVHKDGPVITDNGNFIIDADFGEIARPKPLALKLDHCSGVIEHGIFTDVDEMCVGRPGGRVEVIKRK